MHKDRVNSSVMYGSRVDFVVQHRVQDYWLDCDASTFSYASDAEKRLQHLQLVAPKKDFQLIKRSHVWQDDVCINKGSCRSNTSFMRI